MHKYRDCSKSSLSNVGCWLSACVVRYQYTRVQRLIYCPELAGMFLRRTTPLKCTSRWNEAQSILPALSTQICADISVPRRQNANPISLRNNSAFLSRWPYMFWIDPRKGFGTIYRILSDSMFCKLRLFGTEYIRW